MSSGSNRKPNLDFPEKQGVVWIKDSVGPSGNSSLLAAEDFEYDAIKKAHIEKDFIAFCSSTPGNEYMCKAFLLHLIHGDQINVYIFSLG